MYQRALWRVCVLEQIAVRKDAPHGASQPWLLAFDLGFTLQGTAFGGCRKLEGLPWSGELEACGATSSFRFF